MNREELEERIAKVIDDLDKASPTGSTSPVTLARACLAEIEAAGPTPAMILAGLHTTDMLGVEDIDGEALAAAFKAMIRVALAGE